MALTLYFHPLASFCWKTLIALYENDTPFTPHIVDLGDPVARDAFLKISPMGKFPVLRDDAAERTVHESTIIIEYLAQHFPGPIALLPAEPTQALEVRYRDRFFDHYVHVHMQKIVGDRIRPADQRDAYGVAEARQAIAGAYVELEALMGSRQWAAGDAFSMADCSAAPALFYADKVLPLGERQPQLRAYLERLKRRTSFARTLKEAQPYFHLFPEA
jgi:glutathione S-transferase